MRSRPVEVALGIKPGNVIPGWTTHVTKLFVVARKIGPLVVHDGPLHQILPGKCTEGDNHLPCLP
jgi:hypothetical protein